jgi:uncharacterized membrane protein
MVLACLIFALFTVGLVVPCVIDIMTTPPWAIRTLSQPAWLLIAIGLSLFGCAAWLILGRPRHRLRRMPMRPRGATAGMAIGPAEALRRHPAGRAMGLDLDPHEDDYRPRRPMGPDDDPEFLLELERRIRESDGDR